MSLRRVQSRLADGLIRIAGLAIQGLVLGLYREEGAAGSYPERDFQR